MGLLSTIRDSLREYTARVHSNGSLRVALECIPAADLTPADVACRLPLAAKLVDLDNSNDDNMAINGSPTSARSFDVLPEVDRIKWVTELRLVFHSSGMRLGSNEERNFGAVGAALTNGLRLVVLMDRNEIDMFTDPVTRVGDFYQYAGGAGRGLGVDTGLVNSVDGISAGVDLLVVSIVLPFPIGLHPESGDRMYMVVQDNLTSLTLFETSYYGWQELL